jgi:UDP-N-acetylmuramoyl-L-alanyl-D-glutamate--2,6-diaminopimelate ligase
VLNADDPSAAGVAKQLYAKGKSVLTYGRGPANTLQTPEFEQTVEGTRIHLVYKPKVGREKDFWIDSPLLGDFNVENLACALLLGLSVGLELPYLLRNLDKVNIPGRLDMFDLRSQGYPQDFYVMVDYAHTVNGIERLLNFVKLMPGVNRKITVIGQAGERDKGKRSAVGKIVSEGSDIAIFTEEDPKNEPVSEMLQMMIEDIDPDKKNYELIESRKEAIKRAIDIAEPGDLVMVLGKGAESFMKIGNTKIHYNDTEEVVEDLKIRFGKGVITSDK